MVWKNKFVDDLTIATEDIDFDKKVLHHRTIDGKKKQQNWFGISARELELEKKYTAFIRIVTSILDTLKGKIITTPQQYSILKVISTLKSKTGFVSKKSINKILKWQEINGRNPLVRHFEYLVDKGFLIKNKGGNYKLTDQGKRVVEKSND